MRSIRGIWLTETDLYICGTPVALTAGQHRLFVHMAKRPERVFTYSDLETLRASQCYGRVTMTRNSHSQYISRLRTQIRCATGYTSIITTVQGVGYKLNQNWYDLEWEKHKAGR